MNLRIKKTRTPADVHVLRSKQQAICGRLRPDKVISVKIPNKGGAAHYEIG
ncbi:hypothetical protein [Terribacillus saccharophilus]|uniref:hypothetical protein n=1 Tax=Terribacillus saccharophilus TaxID=361277 RepID=UPI0015CF360F|nr:hypothetical protein [Terribacillus saccharophilus]